MLLAQISDLHIKPDGALYADRIPSNIMAEAAVRHVNTLMPQPDLVLVTGDIVDSGTDAEYERARQILDGLLAPYRVVPGNHDERAAFRRCFADHLYLPAGDGPLHYSLVVEPLCIVALDSTVPGLHHGEIDAAGLAWLQQALTAAKPRPVLLVMHHHPFDSGMGFVDDYILRGGAAIEALVAECGGVEAVLFGHVHRFMARRFGGTIAMACPSTASQIALRLAPGAEPGSVLEPPGCLLHAWMPGKGLVSHLSPIGAFGSPMEFF